MVDELDGQTLGFLECLQLGLTFSFDGRLIEDNFVEGCFFVQQEFVDALDGEFAAAFEVEVL